MYLSNGSDKITVCVCVCVCVCGGCGWNQGIMSEAFSHILQLCAPGSSIHGLMLLLLL